MTDQIQTDGRVEALKIMVSKGNPTTSYAAAIALASRSESDAILQTRYNRVASLAMRDPTPGRYTDDEMVVISDAIRVVENARRIRLVNFLLTPGEKAAIDAAAAEAGQSLSDFIRSRILSTLSPEE